MKRSWFTYLAVGGSLALLVLIAVLQYQGLRQISEADGEKAHKRLQEQTAQFAGDFNREIQNAYFNFQTDAESWKAKDWTDFNERYEYWRERSAHPALISDFVFFAADGSGALSYNFEQKSFLPVEITGELAALRARFGEEKDFQPVYDDILTIVLPIHNVGPRVTRITISSKDETAGRAIALPDRYGFLAIKLNESTIREQILPELATKYFPDGDYNVAVSDQAGKAVFRSLNGENRDATSPLFDLSPENFIQFTNKDVLSSIKGERVDNLPRTNKIILNSRVETHRLSNVPVPEGRTGTFQIELDKGERPRTTVFARTSNATAPPWTLLVQHSSGSLDGALAADLRRNLAIGTGILFLLAAAVATIIYSAHRSRLLAQRQVDFVSSVSHEFRTPLAVIYSAGENLADGIAKEDGQVARYGELIKGEGRKLTGMVEQILDFAGANSGRKKYRFVEVEVADIVSDAVAECGSLIRDNGIELKTDIGESLPMINGDRAALSGAIQNLIVNSIKYGNGNRSIGIKARNGDGLVKISVEDHGIGISRHDLKQIFDPFFRSKAVVDSQIHGNGLGLSLVKQVAEAHGGRVFATSEIGKGSDFTIEIPGENGKK